MKPKVQRKWFAHCHVLEDISHVITLILFAVPVLERKCSIYFLEKLLTNFADSLL